MYQSEVLNKYTHARTNTHTPLAQVLILY